MANWLSFDVGPIKTMDWSFLRKQDKDFFDSKTLDQLYFPKKDKKEKSK